jgi:cytochrome P450
MGSLQEIFCPSFFIKSYPKDELSDCGKNRDLDQGNALPYGGGSKLFDVAKEMIGITLSVICQIAFEYNMPDKEIFSLFQNYISRKRTSCSKLRWTPWGKSPDLSSYRRCAFQASKKNSKISQNIMDAYKGLKAPAKDTIIDRIMKSNAYKNDDKRLADIPVSKIAGHDTTAYSLAWILLELACIPMQMTKLQESLSNVPPEDWSRSEVLGIIVKEGASLHPVSAAVSAHMIGRDIETQTSMVLHKGSIIFLPYIILLHSPNIFENKNTFQPSWSENPTKEETYAFVPFSLGKQSCIGQLLASTELHCIAARICAEFDLEVKEEGTVDYFLTLTPVGAGLIARKAA